MANTGTITSKKNSTGERTRVTAMLSVNPNFNTPRRANDSAMMKTDFVKPNDMVPR